MAGRENQVYYITPFNDDDSVIQGYVIRALKNIENETSKKIILNTVDLISFDDYRINNMFKCIKEADIVVCNISRYNPKVMYELGIAHALEKATLILIDNETPLINFNVKGLRFITYDMRSLSNAFEQSISNAVISAFGAPDDWKIVSAGTSKREKDRKTVFVSYSHKDAAYLERIKIHLKPLERKGLVDLWSDTLILSGDKWKEKIEMALAKAAIVLLLISADFMASDFIVNDELQPLLKSAETKGTIIIPVILKPCSFLREPSLSQFQTINNPDTHPLSKLSEYDQENIYEKISQRIELAIGSE